MDTIEVSDGYTSEVIEAGYVFTASDDDISSLNDFTGVAVRNLNSIHLCSRRHFRANLELALNESGNGTIGINKLQVIDA